MASQQLAFAIKAVNEASKQLKDVQDDLGKAEKSAKDADGALSKMGHAMGDMAKIAGGFVLAQGFMKAPGFLMDAAKAAAEDEQATARLQQTIRSLGGDFDAQLKAVNDAIAAGQKLAFTDDEVRDSFQFLAQATGSTEEALKRQQTAMDLARGANIPLAQATKMLGKMNEENVETFKKLGITIGENATEVDALAAVQAKFGGQAEAYAKSTAGQFEILKIKMGEAKETIGAALLPAMVKIGEVLASDVMPRIEAFAAAVGPAIQSGAKKAGEVWAQEIQPRIEAFVTWAKPKLAEFADWAGEQFQKFQQYYESDIKPALDNIKTGIDEVISFVREHWPEIERIIGPVMEQVRDTIETAVNNIKLTLGIIIDLLGGDFGGAWEKTKDLVRGVVTFWRESIENAIAAITGLVTTIAEAGEKLARALIGAIMDVDWWNVGSEIIKWLGQGLHDMAGSVLAIAGDIAGKIGDKLNPKNWIGSPMGIQNWFPYYMGMGLENMARVVESSPALARARGVMHQALGAAARGSVLLAGSTLTMTDVGQALVGMDVRSSPIEDNLSQFFRPTANSRAGGGGSVTVQIQGSVYGVDDLVRLLDQSLRRAGLAGLA